jgi:peptidoglycan/xylan/chitin deacetylase (PgdA/CDA1 family)
MPATENPLNREAPIGGGYLNTQGVDKAVEAVLLADASPIVLVLHPWEFVDLFARFPTLPRWTKKGCKDNLPALSEFLGILKAKGYEFSTLDEMGRTF